MHLEAQAASRMEPYRADDGMGCRRLVREAIQRIGCLRLRWVRPGPLSSEVAAVGRRRRRVSCSLGPIDHEHFNSNVPTHIGLPRAARPRPTRRDPGPALRVGTPSRRRADRRAGAGGPRTESGGDGSTAVGRRRGAGDRPSGAAPRPSRGRPQATPSQRHGPDGSKAGPDREAILLAAVLRLGGGLQRAGQRRAIGCLLDGPMTHWISGPVGSS